jgi:hypothetical protein
MLGRISKYGWLCGVLLCGSPAFAQANPDTTITAALSSLSARAGVIFAGEVTAIRHINGVVEVDFQVHQNLKNATAGGYVLREWSGLWAAGQRRYWVGENAVVFLSAPGKSGLSSSVDGMEGILPMLAGADISPDMSTAISVDIQRLRARVRRDTGAPMVDSSEQMPLDQVALVVNPPPAVGPIAPPIDDPIQSPVVIPTRPIHDPITRPYQVQAQMPSAMQNIPILVMSSEDSDDFFSTDDSSTSTHKHKTSTTPGSIDAGH